MMAFLGEYLGRLLDESSEQAEEYLDILNNEDSVYFGETVYAYQQRLIEQLKNDWLSGRREQSYSGRQSSSPKNFLLVRSLMQQEAGGGCLSSHPF